MVELARDKMLRMIRGYWVSQTVGALAALAIPDRLAASPRRYDVLAKELGCDPDATYRLLRASATLGLVLRAGDGCFSLTPLGEFLRSSVPGSLRQFAIALTSPGHWLSWGRLAEAVRQGTRQTPAALGQELFEFYAQHPNEGRAFTGAMSDVSEQVADEVGQLIDVSAATHIVDLGGASGGVIAALLEKNVASHGTILELPHVVPQARSVLVRRGLTSRCRVVEGDFFEAVPEADCYILKHIIHDWDDERSVRILLNCVRSLRTNGQVIVIEQVLSEDDTSSEAALADLNMLVLLPGRERTVKQYGELFRAAGLHLDRVSATKSALHVIEASERNPVEV